MDTKRTTSNASPATTGRTDTGCAPVTTAERTIIIHLFSGGSPRELRRSVKRIGLPAIPGYGPRCVKAWLRNGLEEMTDTEIAKAVAALIPASTVHVQTLIEAAPGLGFGPNHPRRDSLTPA